MVVFHTPFALISISKQGNGGLGPFHPEVGLEMSQEQAELYFLILAGSEMAQEYPLLLHFGPSTSGQRAEGPETQEKMSKPICNLHKKVWLKF